MIKLEKYFLLNLGNRAIIAIMCATNAMSIG